MVNENSVRGYRLNIHSSCLVSNWHLGRQQQQTGRWSLYRLELRCLFRDRFPGRRSALGNGRCYLI